MNECTYGFEGDNTSIREIKFLPFIHVVDTFYEHSESSGNKNYSEGIDNWTDFVGQQFHRWP